MQSETKQHSGRLNIVNRDRYNTFLPSPIEVSNKRKEQLVNAMSAAGLYHDIIDSHEGYLMFRAEGGTQYTFTD